MKLAHIIRNTFISAITIGSLLTPTVVHATPAPRLYFETTTLNAAQGSNASLVLRLNANGTPVNTVNVVVAYPSDQLTFAGLDKTGSYFDTFVPTAPKAANGVATFAVASLGKSTSDDVLVSRLLFTAKGTSGAARVTLSSSEAASNGHAIPMDTGSASVNLLAKSDSPAEVLALTKITVSDITTSSGTVRWHTDVPASSSVDYGGTSTYGLTAGADGLVTDHAVPLAAVFSGKTQVHFKVVSVSADNKAGASSDQAFTTKGYAVDIVVKDKKGQPIVGAKVHVGGGKTVETDGRGVAAVEDTAGGNQKVYVNDSAPQIITVKEVTGKSGAAHQQFSLVAARTNASGPMALLALLFIVLAAVLYWAWRRRSVGQPQT
jgi:hypothetical protein